MWHTYINRTERNHYTEPLAVKTETWMFENNRFFFSGKKNKQTKITPFINLITVSIRQQLFIKLHVAKLLFHPPHCQQAPAQDAPPWMDHEISRFSFAPSNAPTNQVTLQMQKSKFSYGPWFSWLKKMGPKWVLSNVASTCWDIFQRGLDDINEGVTVSWSEKTHAYHGQWFQTHPSSWWTFDHSPWRARATASLPHTPGRRATCVFCLRRASSWYFSLEAEEKQTQLFVFLRSDPEEEE